MMFRLTNIILALLLFSGSAVTAVEKGGTTSPFYFGAGARDLALGGASITTTDITTSPFWNPSRLASAERISLGGFHSRLFDSDVSYQYAGFAIPTLDFGAFAIGVFHLGVSGIEKRDASNQFFDQYFDDEHNALYFAYGRELSGFDFGLAATLEHHSIDTYSATSSPGLNISIGKRFVPKTSWISSAAVTFNGRNIIQSGMELADQTVNYPRIGELAGSITIIPNQQWKQQALLSVKLSKVESAETEVAAGLEYSFSNLIQLRGGIRDSKLSAGIGLKWSLFKFDYALVDRDLGSLHMFSLTTFFGSSVSERRKQRSERREAEFNQLMNNKLASKNCDMILKIKRNGKEMLNQGNLPEAVNLLDKALFLARGFGIDTTEIYVLALDAKTRLEEVNKMIRYNKWLDSARVGYDNRKYLAATYYAGMALKESPNSSEAQELLDKANSQIKAASVKEEFIQNTLKVVDSLLSYGDINQATATVSSLYEYAPERSDVSLAYKQVALEHWRQEGEAAFARGDYETASKAADTVFILFPKHRWALDMREQIQSMREQTRDEQTEDRNIKDTPPLSSKLLAEAEAGYKAGQKAFEKGNLTAAIFQWERVERIAPNFHSVRSYLIKAYKYVGVEYYGENKLQEAVTVWKKALSLDKNNTEIENYISRTENEITKLRELSYEQ